MNWVEWHMFWAEHAETYQQRRYHFLQLEAFVTIAKWWLYQQGALGEH